MEISGINTASGRARTLFLTLLSSGLGKTAIIVFSYLAWISLFKLFAVTLITYFLMGSKASYQDISDSYAANEITIIGIAPLVFVILLQLLNSVTNRQTEELISATKLRRRFLPGLLSGSILAGFFGIAFLFSHIYRYLGFFIQADQPLLASTAMILRVIAVVALAYSEEFIFRYRIINNLRRHITDLYAVAVTAVIFCLVKLVQFDIGEAHFLTLFLLSFALGLRAIAEGDFAKGAGFWAGLSLFFHPVFGLPIYGNEFDGLLSLKYQPIIGETATSRFISGGLGGPLSSFALQIILLIDILRSILRNKKTLLIRKP